MKKFLLGSILALSSTCLFAIDNFRSDYSNLGQFELWSYSDEPGTYRFKHDENRCSLDSLGNASICTKVLYHPSRVKLVPIQSKNSDYCPLEGTLYQVMTYTFKGEPVDDKTVFDRKLPYQILVFSESSKSPYPARVLQLREEENVIGDKVIGAAALYSRKERNETIHDAR